MIRQEKVRRGLPKLRILKNSGNQGKLGGAGIPPSALGIPPLALGQAASALGMPPSALGIPPSAL